MYIVNEHHSWKHKINNDNFHCYFGQIEPILIKLQAMEIMQKMNDCRLKRYCRIHNKTDKDRMGFSQKRQKIYFAFKRSESRTPLY